MGASSQTVTLSGSTIWVDRNQLPLRNLPVVRAGTAEAIHDPEKLAAALRQAGQRWDAGEDVTNIALTLDLPLRLDHPTLVTIAKGVIRYAAARNGERPLVLVLQQDYAQALGQAIHALSADLPLVVIDQVGLGEGDFIDIGLPLLGGRVVPLSVKTLIFYHG
jgi:ethanolamine utilization protein EutA